MKRKGEIAETCITIPMEDKKAEVLSTNADNDLSLRDGATLDVLLKKLSILQGYQFCGVCMVELDGRWPA